MAMAHSGRRNSNSNTRDDVHARLRLGGAALTAALLAACATTLDGRNAEDARSPYVADVEVVPLAEGATPADMMRGLVFDDANRDGRLQETEAGVAGVVVSNGRDVTRTDAGGAYALPVRDDMSVFVVQPAGWRVPTDEAWAPQFSYEHKPAGSPKPLRYGGLAPTGPLPAAVNFPLARVAHKDSFRCAVVGDAQAYSNTEISYVRDSLVDDLLDGGPRPDCLLLVGDVMGDDLDLIPRMTQVLGAIGAPQWWVHGNHDFDFDADHDADSADTWRRYLGPAHYAFEMGDVLFIVLDNVVYPCGAEDAARPGRAFCVEDEGKRYNGRITDDQLTFVEGLLGASDPDKTVVIAHHIPFISFVNQSDSPHQTDNVTALYALLAGREALSLAGHTHTIANFAPGDSFAGWAETVGVETLPFRHILAGAASGSWWYGDFDHDGVPMALQRMGAPRGWLDLAFDGPDYVETYFATNLDRDRQMWLSVNTPEFRRWFDALIAWRDAGEAGRDPVPPFSIQDLADLKLLTRADLEGDSWLTANVWAGDSGTRVTVSINDGAPEPMVRTQEAAGEGARIGAEFADPFAAQRQLSMARFAYRSRSGAPRNQGFEVFRGARFGPAAPQPQGSVADRSMHLWRYDLPADLPVGVHTALVRVSDRHGRIFEDVLVFEVSEERPPALWRREAWDAFQDGPPVR